MVDSKNLVAAADQKLFTDHDLSTVERNFSPNHVEHSTLVGNGIPGLKELVTESSQALHHDVLINHNYDNVAKYAHADGTFHQHSPNIADGAANVHSFLSQVKDDGSPLTYANVHRHVADHDFVMTHSERSIGGERHFFCGLWRVEDSKIVELWNVK